MFGHGYTVERFLLIPFDNFRFCSYLFYIMQNETQLPEPDKLLADAKNEKPRRTLIDYFEVINELRAKSLTFREIAEWLCGRGIDADHNAVWRAYSHRMNEAEQEISVIADEAMEREKKVKLPKVYGWPDSKTGVRKRGRKGKN